MSDKVIAQLRKAGVAFGEHGTSFEYELRPAGPGLSSVSGPEIRCRAALPLVSCLMVTRGDVQILKYSAQCYQRQTYPHRELVVITDVALVPSVEGFLKESGIADATVFGVAAAPGFTLGDLRNIAMARSRGDILMQWDDDDLFDPRRIMTAVSALRQSGAAAAFLTRWLIWWPQREIAAISGRRRCEGSMAIWRDYAPVYPAMSRSEDYAAIQFLGNTHPIAFVNRPLDYIYVVTGRNTWSAGHFDEMLAEADSQFQGDDYRDLIKLLSDRVPILGYEAQLRDLAPSIGPAKARIPG